MKLFLKLIPVFLAMTILFAFTSCGTEEYEYGSNDNIEESIGDNENESIGGDESESIGDSESESIGGDESESIGDNESESIGRDENESIGDNENESIGGDKNESTESDENPSFDVTFENAEFVYDGTIKAIQIEGTLPDGVTAYYSGNIATNVGEYQATALLMGEGFKTVTLTATLTIVKADITNVEFARDFYVYTPSTAKTIEISGYIPEGVTVEYSNNYKEEIGTYAVTATLSGENYNTLTLETTLKIVPNITDFSSVIMNSIQATPKAWTFLPDSLNILRRFSTTNEISYTDFVNIADLPTNGMGEQLNSVCLILNASQLASSTVESVYPILSLVGSLYNAYLDTEPIETTYFETDVKGYIITLAISNDDYSLSLSKDGITVTIFANDSSTEVGAKVTYNQSMAIKYTVSEQNLKIAMITTGVMTSQIQVTREEDKFTGSYHQFLGTDNINVQLSSLFEITKDHSIFIGSKGEILSDDIDRQTEVYRNSDGRLVSLSSKWDLDLGFLGKISYNTLYFPIDAISGIENIKKVETDELLNPYFTYVNNSETAIKTTTLGLSAGYKAKTKKFNIEYVDFYFMTLNIDKVTIETLTKSLPVIAIQEECLESFEEDFNRVNASIFAEPVKFNLTDDDKTALYYGFDTLSKTYENIKNAVSKSEIDSWCSEL